MKILITTPSFKCIGGIANHYLGLKSYWQHNVIYQTVGKRIDHGIPGVFWFLLDIPIFIFRLLKFKPDLVILNPMLGETALIRDMILFNISKLFRKKTILFFHGFDMNFEKKAVSKYLLGWIVKADAILVLANEFKTKLIQWNVKCPIYLTTTKVDNKLLVDFDLNSKQDRIENILFLARVVKTKGIYIAVDAFAKLKLTYPYLKLRIVGTGDELEKIKNYTKANNITDITFTGNLSGDLLKQEFSKADLYLLPTFYNEGMPTSVLEALAFGLPIITRPVGGLVDFFIDGEMGYIVDSFNPDDFSDAIEKLIKSPMDVNNIRKINFKFAQDNFMASSVAKNLESLFCKINDI